MIGEALLSKSIHVKLITKLADIERPNGIRGIHGLYIKIDNVVVAVDDDVVVNGNSVTLPYTSDKVRVTKATSMFYKIELLGMKILIGEGRIYLTISPYYLKKVIYAYLDLFYLYILSKTCSRWTFEIFVFVCISESRFWHFMQTVGDSLHEISKSTVWGKIKKNITSLSSTQLTHIS